jgi:hypothetical protein
MTNPYINKHGTMEWLNKNRKLHRVDGPAVIYHDGSMEWLIDGKLHRTDGPAYIQCNGKSSWYINSIRCFNNKSFQKAAKLSDEDMIAIVLKYGDVK